MPALTISDRAAEKVRQILADRGKPSAGVRLSTRDAGCSGMMYTLDYVDEPEAGDELVEDKGVQLYIDAASLMHLIGTEMDYEEDKFSTGFVFRNPNEKGRCGCGESFHI